MRYHVFGTINLEKNFVSNISFESERTFDPQKLLVKNSFVHQNLKKFGLQENIGSNKITGWNFFVPPKNFGFVKFWVQNKFGSTEIWSKKHNRPQKFIPQEIRYKKFGQNQNHVSNSWDIAGIDRCHQDIYVVWTNITVTVG